MLLAEKLKELDYSLLMKSPHLEQESLTSKLCIINYEDEDNLALFKESSYSEENGIIVKAICPSIYIQKIRAFYYFLLLMGY